MASTSEPFAPLVTGRLIVRSAEIGDVDPLHERRNHPDTARYQDWSLPFELEAARRLVAGAVALGGPTDREWWMATVVERDGGRPVGDLAVRLDGDGRAATIGYTFHPDVWGRGYATEAVEALVDRLIAGGVRRLLATIHPDNVASVRLAERVGFAYEGRTVASWFIGDGLGAATTDELLFGLTAELRARWRARPLGRPARVELIEITEANQRAVADLATHYSQRRLVAPVAASYGDALFPPVVDGSPVRPWLRAIAIDAASAYPVRPTGPGADADGADADGADGADDGLVPVGFVMLTESTADGEEPYLWRLLIDRWHQRRGIASAVLDLIEADLRAAGHASIGVNWGQGPGSPGPFYRARGYEPTGAVDDGEIEGRKRLTREPPAGPGPPRRPT